MHEQRKFDVPSRRHHVVLYSALHVDQVEIPSSMLLYLPTNMFYDQLQKGGLGTVLTWPHVRTGCGTCEHVQCQNG